MPRPPPGRLGVSRATSSPMTVATMRSASPIDTSRGRSRGISGSARTRGRGVSRSASGDQLEDMRKHSVALSSPPTSSTPRSANRQRVAAFAAMNNSGSSLRSEGSVGDRSSRRPSFGRKHRNGPSASGGGSGGGEVPEEVFNNSVSSINSEGSLCLNDGIGLGAGSPSCATTPKGSSRGRGKIRRQSLTASHTLDLDDDIQSVATTETSTRRRRGRGGGTGKTASSSSGGGRSRRSRSRSHSKSRGQPRSSSLNARTHLRNRTNQSRINSKENGVSPMSPKPSSSSSKGNSRSKALSPTGTRTGGGGAIRHTSVTRSRSPLIKTSSGSSIPKSKVSENELLNFLSLSPSESERGGRSMPSLESSIRNAGNLVNSGDRSPSRRRERRVEAGTTSSSRPPRNARGVNRTKSAEPDIPLFSGSNSNDTLAEPSSSRGNPSSSSRRRGEATRGVRRAKSTDDMGDLGCFLKNSTATISRRPKPSGARSVVSMPASAMLKRKNKLKNRNSPSNNNDGTDHTEPSSKPPSSKSTITTETGDYDDAEEFFLGESLPELGGNAISRLSMENAFKLHMNKTENLLYDVFPRHIAEALRDGRKVEPENHDCVTIFFSDIVGFTNISSELDPIKVSELLDRLYSSFDALSHYHDVFKVETIGDAYMAVTNLTKEQPDHCKRIAEFAIDAIRVANQTMIDQNDSSKGFVNLRVGFHTGSVVSSVVGSRNPRFCLFGDTVNTASRMESNSEKNRIHCSEASVILLREQHPHIRLNPRGTINVKGKGDMETFWVNEDETGHLQKSGATRSIFNLLRKKKNRRRSLA